MKSLARNCWGIALLVSLFLLLGCGGSQPSIVGKWSATDELTGVRVSLEFTRDGKLLMSMGNAVFLTGTYRVLSANQIEWNRGELWGTQIKVILNYRIQGNKLTIDDPSDPSAKLVLTRG
jgi:hypothetical protein